MSCDEIFDLTAGVYFNFLIIFGLTHGVYFNYRNVYAADIETEYVIFRLFHRQERIFRNFYHHVSFVGLLLYLFFFVQCRDLRLIEYICFFVLYDSKF